MKPAVITVLAVVSALIVLMIIWIGPAVSWGKHSACEQYPLTSNCR